MAENESTRIQPPVGLQILALRYHRTRAVVAGRRFAFARRRAVPEEYYLFRPEQLERVGFPPRHLA